MWSTLELPRVTAEATPTAQRLKVEGSPAASGRGKAKRPQEEHVACKDSIIDGAAGMITFPVSVQPRPRAPMSPAEDSRNEPGKALRGGGTETPSRVAGAGAIPQLL